MKHKFKLSNEASEGLHRRPLYNELIGLLDKPLITHYPDRKAFNLRNSNWLQQLDGDDFQAVKQLNHNIMKDQEKQILLKQYALSRGVPLQEVKAMHTQTTQPEYFNMAAGESGSHHDVSSIAHMEEGHPFAESLFHPEVDTRRDAYVQRLSKLIQSRRNKKKGFLGKVKPRHEMFNEDMDEEVEAEHDLEFDDVMHEAQQSEDKLASFLEDIQEFIGELTMTDVDEHLTPQSRKNKEPSSPSKQERASSSSAAAVYESPVPLRPKAKAKAKAKAETTKEDEPEATHEPRGPAGRPTGSKKKEEPKVKKDQAGTKRPEVVHGTQIFSRDSFAEWMKEPKGNLLDQVGKRKSIIDKFNIKKLSRMNKSQLSNLLIEADK